ncbi:M23 family metallopeptidase [Halalkalibacter sp. APA_J-10(15)]|uniref:M23 family metallopeptidase n=1 Tax=Halalkalibacter sp. APA_J-10(15) TaxID=2933805 RepID=UPI001FF67E3A|nr:M23 family metallopeptidase [Halalkalibacter sp. APA_J-10(15)]MCK0470596.1 M23 family metallopeptidase [Halalkalibacter sp. APA_J-10(15)]
MLKSRWLLSACFILLVGCQMNDEPIEEQEMDENKAAETKQQDVKEKDDVEEGSTEVDDSLQLLSMERLNDQPHFMLNDLLDIIGGEYDFDDVHRTVEITINDDSFYLIDEVPVLERNGQYVATDEIHLTIVEEKDDYSVFLPVAFIEKGLDIPVQIERETIEFHWYGPTERVGGPPEDFDMSDWDVDEMVDYLSFLESPIQGAQVSRQPSHLPGAPRDYRNGFHEGIDWYGYATGEAITPETPIYAMGEGVVVRVDHDFKEYSSPEERNEDLAYTVEIQDTPEYIFDRLRGMQVWVEYPGGVMNRFAHLSGIPEDLQVGDTVDAETVIGYVGNTGTSFSVNGDEMGGLHLHQDLLIYGELFWEPFTLDETSTILQRIWE